MKRSEERDEEAAGDGLPSSRKKVKRASSEVDSQASYFADLFGLNGKVAIVTGGAGVLGTSFCVGLAKSGAKVGILGRTESKALIVARRIEKEGGEAMPLVADVLDKKSVRQL